MNEKAYEASIYAHFGLRPVDEFIAEGGTVLQPSIMLGTFKPEHSADLVEHIVAQFRKGAPTTTFHPTASRQAILKQAGSFPITFSQFKQALRDGKRLLAEWEALEIRLEERDPFDNTSEGRILRQVAHFDPKTAHKLEMRDARHGSTKERFRSQMMRIESQIGLEGLIMTSRIKAGLVPELPPTLEQYLDYLSNFQPHIVDILEKNREIAVPPDEFRKHGYIVGASGSGKSEFLKCLAVEHIHDGSGAVVVIDPHGDVAKQMASLAELDDDKIAYIDPALFPDKIPCLNPLDGSGFTDTEKSLLAQEIIAVFEELVRKDGAGLTTNMQALLLPCLLVLLDRSGSTLSDLARFMDKDRNADLVELGRSSFRAVVREFFSSDSSGFSSPNVTATKQAIATKLFSLRAIPAFEDFTNGASSFNLEDLINQRKAIIFNLSKGRLGALASEALGRFVVARIQAIAMRRADTPESERVPVTLFIDECQNFISTSTQSILEEARKYGISLMLAQQVTGRGMTSEMQQAVLGNTNAKFAGFSDSDATMARTLGLTIEDTKSLRAGQFWMKIGNRRPCQISGYDFMLRDNGAAPPERLSERFSGMAHLYRPKEQQNAPFGASGHAQRPLL